MMDLEMTVEGDSPYYYWGEYCVQKCGETLRSKFISTGHESQQLPGHYCQVYSKFNCANIEAMGRFRNLLGPVETLYEAFVLSRPILRSHAFLRIQPCEVSQQRRTYLNPNHIAMPTERRRVIVDQFPDVIKNNDIEAEEVYIVDPVKNVLSELRNRRRLVGMLKDRRRLQQEGIGILRAERNDDTKAGGEDNELFLVQVGTDKDRIPICKVMDRKMLVQQRFERRKLEKEQAKQSRASSPKENEINWAVTEHDIENKLRQMETFISKGRKVQILLASKKKSRTVSLDEAEHVLNTIRRKIEEVGAKETKPMDGQLLAYATIMVEKK